MKFQLPAILIGLAATVSAQEYNTTGPFYLHVTGKENKTINGYVGSYHAGAAIESLGISQGALPKQNTESYEYYLNYTQYGDVGNSHTGPLVWKLPYNGGQGKPPQYAQQAMTLQYQLNSNVAAAMFGFAGQGQGTSVGFDKKGKLFAVGFQDDSTFKPNTPPAPISASKALYQWYACWQYNGGYYYYSIGWAQTTPPHNPTCQAVDITMQPKKK